MDSNHRRRKPADLQSAPFGHSGNYPNFLGNLIYCLEVVPKTECKSTANFVKHQIFGELFSLQCLWKRREWYSREGSYGELYRFFRSRLKPVWKCNSQCWIFVISLYLELSDSCFQMSAQLDFLFEGLHEVYHLDGSNGKFTTFIHVSTSTFFGLCLIVNREYPINHGNFPCSI